MDTQVDSSRGETKTKKRVFKYYPDDFGNLNVRVKHMDLVFDVFDEQTIADSTIHFTTLSNLLQVSLNAKQLEIKEVSASIPITWEYRKAEDKLIIKFNEEVPSGKDLTITTKSLCKPTKNILEGLYYDVSPKNCPCTQITQCQQWGFQRIVPCFDDMTAKCTYTTTIIANKDYTNIITNGDVSMPRTQVENDRVKVVYENKKVPMATYLFFLGVGCYATFTREFEYPNGKKFMLELLVPPNSNKEIANKALDVLYDSILWINIFTGKDMYQDQEKRMQIYKKVYERNAAETKRKEEIRAELLSLIEGMNFGYEYTGEVYREIGMQNSDFGGMENVGNTTITTNRIMPFPDMTDGGFEYLCAVKCHEFYHNLNGSEVTGQSPFEIWLNEAVTVFIEGMYHEFLFGESYGRLQTISTMHNPMGGTFGEDESVASMPIEPDGFNDTNELITSMTYVKAPEFVRMIYVLLGKEKFMLALHNYHTRYRYKNATSTQWVQCMEEEFGESLSQMAKSWLKQTGFPSVEVSSRYENNTLHITAKQVGEKTWQFPFRIGVVGSSGDIADKTFFMRKKEEEFVFENIAEPEFISYNREGSFYGKVIEPKSTKQLLTQIKKDSDPTNRFLAFSRLGQNQILRVMKGEQIEEEFIMAYTTLLSNSSLLKELGSIILTIFETVEEERYASDYEGVFRAREKVLTRIAKENEAKLLEMYNTYSSFSFEGLYLEKQAKEIKARQVKNLCLGLLAKLDTPNIHELIKTQLYDATNATDRVLALRYYLNSSAKDKLEVLKEQETYAKENPVRWETFLGVVAGLDCDDALDLIKEVEKSDNFDINQANDQRALYAVFARNKRKSLLTSEGREFLEQAVIKLASINEYGTGHVLRVFGGVEKMQESVYVDVVNTLVVILRKLDQEKMPSVYNTIVRMLLNAKKARAKYEEVHGEIPEIKDFA